MVVRFKLPTVMYTKFASVVKGCSRLAPKYAASYRGKAVIFTC